MGNRVERSAVARILADAKLMKKALTLNNGLCHPDLVHDVKVSKRKQVQQTML